jgi:diguanylate cyclase (GGDEF)-like protein/PAS domain S-box-containing protein
MSHVKPNKQTTLQKRLLPPILVLLLLLLMLFWFVLQSLNRQQISYQARSQSAVISGLFQGLRGKRVESMDLAMQSYIRMDSGLPALIAAGDRERLLENYSLTATLLDQRLSISHFYFVGPDRRTVLRMHEPDAFGDRIERETLLRSQRTWAATDGIEQGRNGRLSVRAVHPIGTPEKPLGFLEMGIEIRDLLADLLVAMSGAPSFEYAIFLNKESERGQTWLAGAETRGDSDAWDRYPEVVVADRSSGFPESAAEALLRQAGGVPSVNRPMEIDADERKWVATPMQLDAERGGIQLVALQDVTDIYSTFEELMRTAFATAAALCVLLLAGFYQALRHSNALMEVQRGELLATTERLDLALAVANDGIWDWNLAEDSVVYDDRLYTLAGYEPDAFPSRPEEVLRRIHPGDRDRVQKRIKAYLVGESDSFDVEFRFKGGDGSFLWIRSRGQIVERDEGGKPQRFVGTHSDISALKDAEQETDRSNAMLDKRNRVLDSLNRLSQDLAGANSIAEIGRLTVAQLRMQDGAPLVGIYLCDEDHPDRLLLSYYDSTRVNDTLFEASQTMPLKGSFNGMSLEQGQILHCNDFEHDERIFPGVRELFTRAGAKAETILPLIYRGRNVGTIAIVYLEDPDYSEEDRWAHSAVAQTVSIAIDNLKNIQTLRERQQTAESINELSFELNRSDTVINLAQRALQTLLRNEDAGSMGTFYVVDDHGDWADIIAYEGLEEVDIAAARRVGIEGTWTGAAISTGRVRCMNKPADYEQVDAAVRASMKQIGVESVVSLPLIHDGNRLGAVNIMCRQPQAFDRSRIAAYESMSRTISLALHSAKNTALLSHQASHDSLTGLPNRKALHTHVSELLARCGPNRALTMLLLDLDRFKEVNDTLGHHIGDDLLKALAKRVAPLVTIYGGRLFRLGGDEFAVVAETADAARIARHIRPALKTPFKLNAMTLELDSSIGGAVYPDHGSDSHELLRCADIAMYAAKNSGKGFELYDLELDDKNPQRLELLGALRNALGDEQLYLVYQPRVDIARQRVSACEALLRWEHPTLGTVPPDEFIPLAELTDVIHTLTPWVIRSALSQMSEWRSTGITLKVSVNISGRNLIDMDFPQRVESLLREFSMDPRLLEFEITETALVSDPDRALTVLRTLSHLGISIAIDDFGTGFSSLELSQAPAPQYSQGGSQLHHRHAVSGPRRGDRAVHHRPRTQPWPARRCRGSGGSAHPGPASRTGLRGSAGLCLQPPPAPRGTGPLDA